MPVVNGDALVAVEYAGICGTDLQILDGYVPFAGIPGHEFTGRVVECPSSPTLIDKRVVASINLRCAGCDGRCNGVIEHCEKRSAIGIRNANGVFAEYINLPIENLYTVPEHVLSTEAVFAEPLAAALRILEQVNIGPGKSVLLIGAGRLGQIIARVLATTLCDLQVIARYDNQRRLLQQVGIPCRDEHHVEERKYDLVIESAGSPSGLPAAIKAVKPRGTIVLKSTYTGSTEVSCADLVVNEIELVGSRCGPMDAAVRLLGTAKLHLEPLIDGIYRLEDIAAAFAFARRSGTCKVLIRPD
jgi:2-desacetyl-2-hydroxyethyl bacteriochlorophyllide A dehydrogenase